MNGKILGKRRTKKDGKGQLGKKKVIFGEDFAKLERGRQKKSNRFLLPV